MVTPSTPTAFLPSVFLWMASSVVVLIALARFCALPLLTFSSTVRFIPSSSRISVVQLLSALIFSAWTDTRRPLPSICFHRLLRYYEPVGLPVSRLVASHVFHACSHTALRQNLQDLSCSPASLLMPPRQALRPRKSRIHLAFSVVRCCLLLQGQYRPLSLYNNFVAQSLQRYVFGSAASLSYA